MIPFLVILVPRLQKTEFFTILTGEFQLKPSRPLGIGE
jgi:hypothetical protein